MHISEELLQRYDADLIIESYEKLLSSGEYEMAMFNNMRNDVICLAKEDPVGEDGISRTTHQVVVAILEDDTYLEDEFETGYERPDIIDLLYGISPIWENRLWLKLNSGRVALWIVYYNQSDFSCVENEFRHLIEIIEGD